MSIEQYINFKALSFGTGEIADLRYSARGSTREHVEQINEGLSTSRYDRITPEENAALIWGDLLTAEPLELPKKCEVCPDDRQVYLWRTFTPASLQGFKEAQGKGAALVLQPPPPNLDMRGMNLCNTSDVNQQGVLWTAKSPDLALSVGLSRTLVAGEPITLLGFKFCVCDMKEGIQAYETFQEGKFTILDEIKPKSLTEHSLFNAGEIVSEISERQIADGVAYVVEDSFFAVIKEALGKREPTDRNLKYVSCIINNILLDLAIQIPGVDEFRLNTIPRAWKPFLKRIPNAVFKW